MSDFICNAFSLNMLGEGEVPLTVRPLSVEEATVHARFAMSAVGHADTAALFTAILGVPVACNRTTVRLEYQASALVGQYSGPRLPEGATSLPEGATVKWFLVRVEGWGVEDTPNGVLMAELATRGVIHNI